MSLFYRQGVLPAIRMGAVVVTVFAGAVWHVVRAAADPIPSHGRKVVVMSEAKPRHVLSVEEGAVIDPDLVAPAGEDPFRPLPNTASAEAAKPTPVAPAAMTGAISTPPTLGGTGPLLPLAPVAEAAAPMQVTGIVLGVHPSAVVQVAGEETIVRLGSRLPNGATVEAIGPGVLTLRHDGKLERLLIVE